MGKRDTHTVNKKVKRIGKEIQTDILWTQSKRDAQTDRYKHRCRQTGRDRERGLQIEG